MNINILLFKLFLREEKIGKFFIIIIKILISIIWGFLFLNFFIDCSIQFIGVLRLVYGNKAEIGVRNSRLVFEKNK